MNFKLKNTVFVVMIDHLFTGLIYINMYFFNQKLGKIEEIEIRLSFLEIIRMNTKINRLLLNFRNIKIQSSKASKEIL